MARAKVDPHLAQLRRIVATLPEAVEDTPWGSIHWKVRGKIFAGWDRDDDGASSIGFKTDKDLQATLVRSDPRFTVAAYVGKHGWVDMDLGEAPDWHEVEHFLVESYKMIAPATLARAISSAPMPARALGGKPGPKPRGPASKRRAASPKSPRGTK